MRRVDKRRLISGLSYVRFKFQGLLYGCEKFGAHIYIPDAQVIDYNTAAGCRGRPPETFHYADPAIGVEPSPGFGD